MKTILSVALLFGALFLAQPSAGVNYMSLTDSECIEPLEPIPENPSCERYQLTGRDTIWGGWRTNDCFSTANTFGLPLFFGPVISAQPSFCAGSPNPPGRFYGDPPTFNAPVIEFPDSLLTIRAGAEAYGAYLYFVGHEWYCSISGTSATFYHYPEGTVIDTLSAQSINIPLSPNVVVFVDGKLDIRGVMNAQGCELVLGCSRDIRLIDNVMLQGTNMTNGTIPYNATSRIAIASEGNILIGNTWENGRKNRTGPAPNNRNIVITALIFAVRGSFTFEQQNDPQDSYVCDCFPDERGNIILTGAIAQRQRGYTHRSNLGGTGYNKVYHYDYRLQYWNIGVFESLFAPDIPDTFTFADSPVGVASWDTLLITGEGPFSGALATTPFFTNAGYEYNGPTHRIPIRFTPPSVGPFYGTLTFYLNAEYRSITLRGNGIPTGGPQIVETEIYPNPFNNTSTFRFTLPEETNVRALVYDVLGREVAQLADGHFASGEHTLQINAAEWSSGVYFMTFQSGESFSTHKLLLLK